MAAETNGAQRASALGEVPLAPNGTADLTTARLDALLLYGLTLDDDDPELGVVLGVRRELSMLAALAETGQASDLELAELGPVLESLGRRLEVAIELRRRGSHAIAEG